MLMPEAPARSGPAPGQRGAGRQQLPLGPMRASLRSRPSPETARMRPQPRNRRSPHHPPRRRAVLLSCLALFLSPAVAAAQPRPAAPPPPEKYLAEVRYSIPAARDQHVARYRELLKHLERLGFEADPAEPPPTDPED